MGIYVNPGNTAYQKALHSQIYIDKTDLITVTNSRIDTMNRFMCVSRPRRFGKSVAADMLTAYYSMGCDSENLFAGLKIEKDISYKTHLNRHHVIRLDVQRFVETRRDLDTFITKMEKAVAEELLERFPDCRGLDTTARLKAILDKISVQTGQSFIFIIDEWDCVFRIAKEYGHIQKNYLDFLRGLFKGAGYVELAYMTGILPIKKYGEHSAINIFDEYSMVEPKNLGKYFGFTKEEVQEQCRQQGIDPLDMEKWYDGYQLGDLRLYNPKSVADALMWKEFQSYWTGTETYEALKIYIDIDFDGLKGAVIKMIGNGRCKINTRKFQNDMTTFKTKDDIFTLLVHLGYLTYDKDTNEVSIPNQEVTQEFLNAVDDPGWGGVTQSLKRSEDLLKDTWALNGQAVADGIAAIHSENTSILKYNDENSLTCTILMAYYSARAYYMDPILELPSGKGYADVVYLPKRHVDRPALLIELKRDRSALSAIDQIENKQYASWIQDYTGDILLVGINYDRDKKHTCMIKKHAAG